MPCASTVSHTSILLKDTDYISMPPKPASSATRSNITTPAFGRRFIRDMHLMHSITAEARVHTGAEFPDVRRLTGSHCPHHTSRPSQSNEPATRTNTATPAYGRRITRDMHPHTPYHRRVPRRTQHAAHRQLHSPCGHYQPGALLTAPVQPPLPPPPPTFVCLRAACPLQARPPLPLLPLPFPSIPPPFSRPALLPLSPTHARE